MDEKMTWLETAAMMHVIFAGFGLVIAVIGGALVLFLYWKDK